MEPEERDTWKKYMKREVAENYYLKREVIKQLF